MKYATFLYQGQQLAGAVDLGQQTVKPLAFDMMDIIKQKTSFEAPSIPFSQITLLAPIPKPGRNVFCVGKNYHEHLKEVSQTAVSGDAVPEYPIFFTKADNCIIGPNQSIKLPKYLSSKIDYEAELAVVIGKTAKNITLAQADEHIFGYMIANDVTARDIQKRHQQWFLGKSLDTFLPMGPWIVTKEEIGQQDLTIKCWVNGELRQESSISKMIFNIPSLIVTLAAGITLRPGDIIATGTPAGVGMGFNPPRFLRAGDHIKITISHIGDLENRVSE